MDDERRGSRLTPGEVLALRSAFLDRIRSFFRERGFVELDTPLLVASVPTEAHIAPFSVTLHRAGATEGRFLPTSPEGALKRQLALLGRDAFEIGHAFRDGEEEGPRHRAHFRMLEWYRLDADHTDVRRDVAELLRAVAAWLSRDARDVAPGLPATPGVLAAEPVVVPVPDALATHLQHPIDGPEGWSELLPLAHRLGHASLTSWQEAFHVLMALVVEPRLPRDRPVFLTDYPAGLASMARPRPGRPWLAEQFELFVGGVELANCYGEITDAAAQRARFAADARRAAAEGRTAPPPDEAFLAALDRLPARTAGGSVGLERLLMVGIGAESLDAVRPGW